MHNKQIRPVAYLFSSLIALTGGVASANELGLPTKISCANGNVIIKQISPSTTYLKVSKAVFKLWVNGNSEIAAGSQQSNVTDVVSENFYIYKGAGGLVFARHRGKPYFGHDGNAELICIEYDYQNRPSPGFSAFYD